MPQNPPANDPRLILVQRLWRELHAARKDPLKYRGLTERIRRESELLWQERDPRTREHLVDEWSNAICLENDNGADQIEDPQDGNFV